MTAFGDAIRKAQEEGTTLSTNLPSHYVAGDTLNEANNNETFIEAAADTLESIPKFIGVSLISGANQLYNIPANIGNLLGADYETVDAGDLIAAGS